MHPAGSTGRTTAEARGSQHRAFITVLPCLKQETEQQGSVHLADNELGRKEMEGSLCEIARKQCFQHFCTHFVETSIRGQLNTAS